MLMIDLSIFTSQEALPRKYGLCTDNMKLMKYTTPLREIVTIAHGENALENFLIV